MSPSASRYALSCGSCVAACPTGAIEPKLSPANAVKQTSTVCPYCGVGCGIVLNTDSSDKVLVGRTMTPTTSRALANCVSRAGSG